MPFTRQSLHNPNDFQQILSRLENLSAMAVAKWGRMDAAGMLCHCTKVLEVATGKTVLPEINIFLKTAGIVAKKEMWLFGNGIPPNMPTFEKVISPENCNFNDEKIKFKEELSYFLEAAAKKNLVEKHPLFGKMSYHDWGFLEFKHIDHHFKQFRI